ncbi:MAG: electron transport complex subunit RsxG [Thiohalomonadales bacterium]|nr:electron transport complex subunit RsxG [Thiohalomonadales bacterium]
MPLVRHMMISAVLLGLFAIAGTSMVAIIYGATEERIAANEREFLLKSLHKLISPGQHDNDLFNDVITVQDKELLGTAKPVRVYRARLDKKPVAAIINSVAPDGYSGSIELLVAIRYDGTLAGVRVVKQKETPGLGDAIDASKSDWILGFNGRSLSNPDKKGWAVKRDGGIFDQFTGATISPRAVVNAVHRSLLYFSEHRDELFDKPSMPLEGQP